MKYQKIRQQAFRSTIWLVAALFITSLSPGNALAATGISVGSSSLNLGATENLYYGAMGTGSSATGGGILIQKPGGTNIFKVDALGGGYFAGNVGIGTTAPGGKLDVAGAIENGLVLWLPMDEASGNTTADYSVNSYNGTLLPAGSIATRITGKFNKGLLFDGTNDWVQLSSTFSMPSPSTLSVWVKTTTSSNKGIFSNCAGSPVGLAYALSSGRMEYRYYNGGWFSVFSTATINDGKWHLLAWVKDSNTSLRMYIDGVLDSTQVINMGSGSPMNSVGSLWGTCDTYSYETVFVGSMDDFRVYNRVLSKRELAELYGQQAPTLAQGGTITNDFLFEGNVGVGATAPTDYDSFSKALDIAGTNGAALYLRTAGDTATRFTIGATASQYYLYGYANSPMVFYTNHAEAMRILGGGNVGIGTTAPDVAKLQILTAGSGITQQQAYGDHFYSLGFTGHDAYLSYYTAAGMTIGYGEVTGGVPSVNTLRLLNNGNVGINTTNPTQKLHVAGAAQFDAVSWGVAPGSSQTLALATVGYVNAASASGTWTKSGTSIYPTTLTDNVGIGTTNPTNKLGIDAGVNTKALTVYTTGNDGNYSAIGFQYSAALPAYGRSEIRNYISNGGAEGNLAFLVNDAGTTLTERMRIVGSSGNVGIGTTNPTSKLTLDGGRAEIRSGGILMLRNAANDYDFDIQQIGYTLQFGSASMSNVAMTYDTTGNVGIGLTNPSYSLDIKSGGTPIRIGSTHTGYGATIEMDANVYGAGGRRWIVFSSGSTNGTIGGGKFALYDASGISPDSAAYRFLIDTAGNVGIGTTNPTRKLSISAPAGNGAGIGLSTNLTGTEQEIFRVSNTGSGVNDGMLTLSENGVTKVLIGANNARSGAGYFNGGGNIGINTTSPDAQMSGTYGLAIYKSTYPSVGFKNDTTSWLWYGDGAYLKMWNVSAGDMLFAHSGGNIGIGVAPGSYKLDVNGNIRTRANFYADSNYGYGLVGVYNASRYQGVYAMGDSYKLAVDGTAPGSLYGIAWTHENVGGQSKVGLGHQALFMMNGITYTAVGSGVWTNGNVTASGGNVSATGSVSGGTLCIGADCRASWPGVNSDTVDTYHASQLQFYQSNRDFPNGTLIQTNIWYNDASGEPFLLEIEGNSYGNLVPLDLKVQGYIYSSTLINVGGVSNGLNISGLVAFNYNGYLCFWFPSQGYWNGYSIFVNSSYEGVKNNRLVSVTHAAKPGGVTKEVALTAAIRQSLHTSGGTMAGSINMNSNNISGINDLTATKLYVGTIDPLYYLNGVNYATFVSSISGGVKEEYIGKIKLDQKNKITKEYEATIDFSTEAEGSDLWVWHQVVDFNQANVEVLLTPYGQFAQAYYVISGDKLIFRSDRQVELSYRLIGKRWDWQKWPTKAEDQTIKGIEITSKNK
jgi:hypothetical protein